MASNPPTSSSEAISELQSNQAQESAELHALADSLLLEIKQARPVSTLETSIFLFRKVLKQRPPSHPLRSEALRYLALSLLTRFVHNSWIEDFDESFKLIIDMTRPRLRALMGSDFPDSVPAIPTINNDLASNSLDEAYEGESESEDDSGMIAVAISGLREFSRSVSDSSVNTTIQMYREALALRPASDSNRIKSLLGLSEALIIRFQMGAQVDDLNTAISLLREVLQLQPQPDPHRFRNIIWLCSALQIRSQIQVFGIQHLYDALDVNLLRTEANDEDREARELLEVGKEMNTSDNSNQLYLLDNAISLMRSSLLLRPHSHSFRSETLDSLSAALGKRFDETSQLTDLEEALSLSPEALMLRPPPHPYRVMILDTLGDLLMRIFEHRGQLPDLEAAITSQREGLDLRPVPHSLRYVSLTSLGRMLSTRFERLRQLNDLGECISVFQEALDVAPETLDSMDRVTMLSNLASALSSRHQIQQHPADLEKSIALFQEAMDLGLPQPALLNGLASVLRLRFKEQGQLADLEQSIIYYRQALLLLSSGHANRSLILEKLGIALQLLFQVQGRLADLEESILILKEALALRPVPHSQRHSSLTNLANSLSMYFERTGALDQLDQAIALQMESLAFPHPDRVLSMTNVAQELHRRFEYTNSLDDLSKAISYSREALALIPGTQHSPFIALIGLGGALIKRFERQSQDNDLVEAISLFQKALSLVPAPHPSRPGALNNLAGALYLRFKKGHQHVDLDDCIAAFKEVIELCPAAHSSRSALLKNASFALVARFEEDGDVEDLEESIRLLQQSLGLLPDDHPQRSLARSLAFNLLKLHYLTDIGQYLEDAIDAFRIATTCNTAAVRDRYYASRGWASAAVSSKHKSTMEAYHHAISLLPRLSAFEVSLEARQEALTVGYGLACEACGYAIQSGEIEKAVEFLSEGRAVFWSQALRLRTPLEELELIAPQLAKQLSGISRLLEQASMGDSSSLLTGLSKKERPLADEAAQFRRLNNEWNNTVDEVRKLKRFENFLRPKSFADVMQAVANGTYPIVLLTASKETERCDGLILNAEGAIHIPFPNLTSRLVDGFHSIIQITLSAGGRLPELTESISATFLNLLQIIDSENQTRKANRVSDVGISSSPEHRFRLVLTALWETVVNPVIKVLDLQVRAKTHDKRIETKIVRKKSTHPKRLWWCPTGSFSFLPIHAAGRYDLTTGEELDSLANYAISSYIPTLEYLQASPTVNAQDFKMLAIAQAEIPGKPRLSLPFTLAELERIEQHVPREHLIKLGTKDAPTTIEKVLSHLSDASIAHFACHGIQDTSNSLESALLLGDGDLKIKKIMETPMPNASLAFLSACETAKGDEGRPDEAMHIAATMLFAGFKGVVGTMWTINDDDAPLVADVFYGSLFRGDPIHGSNRSPDMTEAAYALHLAVKQLRVDKKVSFRRWVPFIHFGL